MKRNLLILITFFAFKSNCSAQYFPLFGTNDIWLQQEPIANTFECRLTNITQNSSSSFLAPNGSTYYILHHVDPNLPGEIGNSPYYLREDCVTKKVYFYHPSTNQEYLAYDFSLTSVGQTVTVFFIGSPLPITLTVVNISSTSPRRIELTGQSINGQVVWVEGLGSLAGIIYNSSAYQAIFGWDTKLLLCHSRSNISDYRENIYCTDLVGTFSCPNPQPPTSINCNPCPNPPSISIDPLTTTICSGSSTTLTASGATTYSWNTNPVQTGSSISVSPATTTIYTVTGTDVNGCSNTATSTVTVNPLPTVTVTSPTICGGARVQLIASGATTYTWTGGLLPVVNPTTPQLSSTRTYTVTGTTNGCSNSASSTVTVIPKPAVVASASLSNICLGPPQNSVLSFTPTVGLLVNGWFVGSCTNGTGASGVNLGTGLTLSVSPTTNTTYNVEVQDVFGCRDTACVGINVNTNPTVIVTSPIICSGQTAQPMASGATTYTWTGGLSPEGNPTTPQLSSTTTYTVTGTTNGCTGTATSTVTVKPLPTIIVNSPSICSGQTATLTATGAGINGTYTWTDGLTGNPATTPTLTNSTTYTVTGTNTTTECSNTAISTVSITESSTVSITPITTPMCANTTRTIIASPAGGTFTVVSGPGTINANTGVLTSTGTGVITVSYSIAGDCGGSDQIQVTVVPNNLTISVPSQSICPNTTATLTASSTPADPTIAYTWTGGLGTGSTVTTPILTANTTYTVTGTSTTGCGTAIATVSITPPPTISASSTSACGTTVRLLASGASTYSWNTTPVSTANPLSVTPTATTTYTVTGTTNSCSRTASVTITVDPNCGSCCANTCPWTLNGNGAINAAPRGTIGLASSCLSNNYIGTRTNNGAPVGTNDLVFGANGNGWMRLTTTGGLFLTDNTLNANNGFVGNIKIGMFAANNLAPAAGPKNIFMGQYTAFNAASFTEDNVVIGDFACYNNTLTSPQNIGRYNTIIGHNAARNINSPAANGNERNTIIGFNASTNITTGTYDNVIIGHNAGGASTPGGGSPAVGNEFTGNSNSILGSAAGFSISTGSLNTFIGKSAGYNNTTGTNNTFVGNGSGLNINNGKYNIFIGNASGSGITGGANDNEGSYNIEIGTRDNAYVNSNIKDNIIMGRNICYGLNGNSNTLIGNLLFHDRVLGQKNVIVGSNTTGNGTGDFNVGLGESISIHQGSTGTANGNIAIGSKCYTSGDNNIAIISGNNGSTIVNMGQVGGNNTIAIGFRTKSENNSIAIGPSANAKSNSIALGINAKGEQSSIALGNDATALYPNSMVLGNTVLGPATTFPSLKVGIGTNNPSTTLHIDCNPDAKYPSGTTKIPANGSAVRFQGLQPRPCNTTYPSLVIDPATGYVFINQNNPNCRVANNIDDANTSKTDSLLKRIEILEQKLNAMENDVEKCCSKTGSSPVEDFPMSKDIKLYQNVPNPFTIGTEIKFFVPETVKEACLIIYDLNGREIRKIDIIERNESSIKIQGKELAAGMYIYSLIADSKEIDSKRMILTGN